jgi:ADP-ribose pyrophosphatase YjhB (NUDIX family)
MRQERRIAAYGVCRDGDGRVLLARSSALADMPGVWQIPGGGVDHGEHPAEALVREFAEETGLVVAAVGLRGVVADVIPVPRRGVAVHTDRVIYDVAVRGGELRDEVDGTTDLTTWVSETELPELPLMPFTAELLSNAQLRLTGATTSADPTRPPALAVEAVQRAAAEAAEGRARGQRFGAYGLVTDPAGRVLLTLIAEGYPGAGRWHLPGGGTDHGEQPVAALLRELAEEADQVGRVTALLDVSHRRNPAAPWRGGTVDWHVVRALYRVEVDMPVEPRVTEAAGGSTADAGWFTRLEALRLPLTEVAAQALRRFMIDMTDVPGRVE